MFGHLKAEDFVNLMEGTEPPAKHKTHLDACSECRATWDAVKSVHNEMSSIDLEIPEPDWSEFRSSVRDGLLSRSIQRQSAVRRWTGWAIRPAVAWALSVVLAIGLTTVTLMWNAGRTTSVPSAVPVSESPAFEPAAEGIEPEPERALFDDILQLGDEQQEQLRQLLEAAQRGTPYRQ